MPEPNLDHQLAWQLEQLNLVQSAETRGKLLLLQAELLRWNRSHNLTAITDPLEALELHLVDSLCLLPFLPTCGTLLDIGSGAGFPGLPLKLVRPDLALVSVDAVGKKIRFQRHMVRRLVLDEVDARHARAETLADDPQVAGRCQFATSRAFGSLELFARLARPCMAPGGLLVAMKGPQGEEEVAAAADQLESFGFQWQEARRYRLPTTGHRRSLLVWSYRPR